MQLLRYIINLSYIHLILLLLFIFWLGVKGVKGVKGEIGFQLKKIFKKLFLFYFYFLSEYFQALHRSPFTAPQPRIFRIIQLSSLLIINFDEFESKPRLSGTIKREARDGKIKS